MSRRQLGQLEAEILAVLASKEAPVTIADLVDDLAGPPAHTTVHTVLGRLLKKGMLERTRDGRSYVYHLTVDESQVAADKMFSPLRSARDPRLVLNQFAQGLSPDEVKSLRAVLDEAGRQP